MDLVTRRARRSGMKRYGPPTLEGLARQHLPARETDGTAALFEKCRAARRRGYLTMGEFVAACYWKSPRPINLIRANTHHRVRAATRAVLATRSEVRRLEALRQLDGVSVPTASAILTLLDPRRYGVIDIRVWQVLYSYGAVRQNPKGTNLTVAQWREFLAVLRKLSARLGRTVREVELSLFNAHTASQDGLLYDGRSAKKME
jgi:hypothetical protein